MVFRTASLSRSSSMTSESDIDNPNTHTHRRGSQQQQQQQQKSSFSFNQHQRMLLDELWHRTARPTREERARVAQSGGMTERSVTTWFQSRRHHERKSAIPPLPPRSTSHRHYRQGSDSRSKKPPMLPFRSYPSLDLIASRTERADPKPKRTPRPCSVSVSMYDNMPSSPLAPSPSSSPPPREYVRAFGRVTLEWACARSRVVEREKETGKAQDMDKGKGKGKEDKGAGAGARLVRSTTWSEVHVPDLPPALPPRGGSRSALGSGSGFGYKHYALPPPMEAPTRASAGPDADTLDAAFILCGMVDERPA